MTTQSIRDEIERCYDLGWTDGLPVVPPTSDRVGAMLGTLAGRRREEVATLLPAGGIATYEKIAANAVMAGCLPEYFPVVLAAVRAAADPAFELEAVLTTVHSLSPLVLVNGPLARDLGLNGGTGALGAGCRANATIGRALMLCLRNIAGAIPGKLDPATIGHPGKYSYCYTENTDLSPWPELHTTRGFTPQQSAVTLYGGDAPLCVTQMGQPTPEAILGTIAECAAIPGAYNAFFRQDLWMVLSPDHAHIIAGAGWTRADVQRFLYEQARIPVEKARNRGLHGFVEVPGITVPLEEIAVDGRVPIVDSPDRVIVTVAGGPYGGYTALVFGMGVSVSAPVEVRG